jgi:4-hydroxy-tetrahydrodipicolinate synthase
MFKGSLVALITPFKDGKVDYVTLGKLVEWHADSGTDALVPCGTTGESPTLTIEEHRAVIRSVIETARGRIPVVAGTGSNDTAEAVRLTKFAAEAGASGALVVLPYYNKPTQEGLYEHFKAVAECSDLPVILYNIPGRCGVGLEAGTIARLYELPNVAAIKDATGSVTTAMDVLSMCDITVLSGDDALTVPLMSIGASGVVSVAANIMPGEIVEMTHAALDGNFEKARAVQAKLHGLVRALFAETNPIGVKAALEMLGKAGGEIRLPLTRMTEGNAARLREELEKLGILKP